MKSYIEGDQQGGTDRDRCEQGGRGRGKKRRGEETDRKTREKRHKRLGTASHNKIGEEPKLERDE